MTTTVQAPPRSADPVLANLLVDYYDRMPDAIATCVGPDAPLDAVVEGGVFAPGFALPELDDAVRAFLSVATAGWQRLGEHGGHPLTLLDLTGNPGTGTTKTFASLLIVLRAVEHVRRTGEAVTIFSPTSANKGTALRDAVLRAYDAGLVTPDELRVVVLAPASCRHKLRASRLSADPELRARNPLLLYTGTEAPEHVKALGRAFVDEHAATLGTRLWFSLELRNYLVADTARAFFEHDVAPTDAPGAAPRLHAHAVSSAFGLLGYHHGRDVLETAGAVDPATRPASLLVQHTATSDMVINLRHGDFDRGHVPAYTRDAATGLFTQSADPRFPAVTYDPDEVLDPTFYTRRPATSPAMNALIADHGGDGIVVSLAECVERYPRVRELLTGSGCALPADFRELREWSVVMAVTGVLNAIDRGLVAAIDGPGSVPREVVVHGSGVYTTRDLDPIDTAATRPVRTVADVLGAVTAGR